MPPKPPAYAHQSYWIAAGLAVLIYVFQLLHILDFHEADAFDLRMRLRGEQPAHPKIVVLAIDDAGIESVGQWPWPRNLHASLLDALSAYRPALIFFDIFFTEKGLVPEHDHALAEAVAHAGRVVMPFFYVSEKPFKAYFPIPEFREAALATGFVNVEPERDGVTRRFRPSIEGGGERYYHPAVLAVMLGMDDPAASARWFENLPTDASGKMWLQYPGKLESFKVIPFLQLVHSLDTEDEPKIREMVKDSIVIIGHVATGTTDILSTPFTPTEAGVTVQASAFHTLMNGKYLRSSPWWLDLLLLILLSLGVMAAAKRLSPRRGALCAAGMLAGYVLVNLALFWFARWILPLFMPLAVIAAVYVAAIFIKYIEARFTEEILNRELATAARIQSNILPSARPEFPSLDMQFECKFIKQVGGDLFDWTPLENGTLAVCVGDVSGKGMPAALYMAKAMSEFRRDPKVGVAPKQVNANLNNCLARSGQSGMFLTLYYAVIDTLKKKLTFSSAGQDPMVYYHHATHKAELVEEAQGSPLGMFEDMEYEEWSMPYRPGDLFVVVTDGIKELRNAKKEEFGMERLRDCVQAAASLGKTAEEVVAEVFYAMKQYQKGAQPHDDRTILCVRFR